MEAIISKIYQLLKDTEDFISFEEQLRLLMYKVFSQLLEEIFSHLDEAIVEAKKKQGWKRERRDKKDLTFSFGSVRFQRSLMYDADNQPRYPLDEWLGLHKYQRYSPMVEVKVAELAKACTYRETAQVLKEWTAVDMSHTTVGKIIRGVGKAQSQEDEEMVLELEESASLPEGKKVGFLMAEADGVFVRSTKRKKNMEVHHAVMHEGWDINGKRVSLRHPRVILTTLSTDAFWGQVQAMAAQHYSLENTHVVTNSDGGVGYTADRFQEAFSQSKFKVINQLDSYHISQAFNRTFGVKSKWKTKVSKAIKDHDFDQLTLLLDTYESRLEDSKQIKRLKDFRSYIVGNWDRTIDWRKQVENPPENARGLGAMESNQRHVSFRMKKRGMHWSTEGSEAMVKIIQGTLNGTLREAYIKHQHRSTRQQREVKKVVNMAQILRDVIRPSIGAKNGRVSLNGAHSSAIGQLVKSLR